MVKWTFHIAIGLWVACFVALKILIDPPIPASVLMMYMVLLGLAILLFVAANETRFQYFKAPLKAVFKGDAPVLVQVMVLAAIPLLVGWGVYLRTVPSFGAPLEPRIIHPQPPIYFQLKGKKINMVGLKNPMRTSGADLERNIAEGKTIYYKNCFFCHGDTLEGDGHFALALTPIPGNFSDVGTLSMLQESYVFWRIATGAPGLPKGATPWNSAMPAWQDYLTEDEIWKVTLFIYAASGSTPRTWEKTTGEDKL